MGRRITKILIGIAVIIAFLLAALWLGSFFFQDKVKAFIVKSINDQVTVPVYINGGIDFSLFSHFPYASVTFKEVSVKSKLQQGPKELLQVKEFSFLFNIWGLLSDKIEVSKVYANHGTLNLYLDAAGNANYDIFKTGDGKSSSGSSLDLKKAIVENVQFTYLSENKDEEIRLLLGRLTLSGNFKAEKFDLDANTDILIRLLKINGDEYLSQKSFHGDIIIDVDQHQNRFSLRSGAIELEQNPFSVTGYFVAGKKSTYVNFNAETHGKDISKLIELIPLQYKKKLEGTAGKGNFAVTASVIGDIKANINPSLKVTANLENASITLPKVSRSLTEVSASGYYSFDSIGRDELSIRNFTSKYNGDPLSFNLKLTHLSDPDFIFDANGIADMHALGAFFSDSMLQNAEGKIAFHDFHLKGSKKDISHMESSHLKTSGKFDLKNISLKLAGVTYDHINGQLAYHDNIIDVNGFSLNFLNTDASFNGKITDLLPYVISQTKHTNNADLPLGIDGSLKMKEFNLTTILAAFDKKDRQKPGREGEALNIRDIFNMDGHLDITIDKFIYEKMLFQDVKAQVALAPYKLNITSLTTHAMGGDITNTGYVAFTPAREMIMNFRLNIDKVDLPQIFAECDNFGQKTLTDKNLKGRVSATLEIKTVWNNYKDIDLGQIVGNLSCSVLHGELLNFEPLKAASSFIKVEELNHIVFSDLSNQLFIHDGKISIPKMEVQSSALNLIMSGTHTFNNDIDYHIKVNLRKLLANKFNRNNNDGQYIEDDPYDGVNLFLQMTGNIANPKIKYDKGSVNKKIKQDLVAQKEELKGLFKKDKTPKTKDENETKREEKYFDTRKKPETIDFEEDKKE